MSSAGNGGAITIRPTRSIGAIQADATISETGVDETTITQHPVEQGAAITDHAFSNPSLLTIEAGWSNSSPQAGGDPGYCTAIYQKLLDMKNNRIPFDVITAQRKYPNQLIRTLTKRTDEKTENALMVVIICQEVILVETQTSVVPKKSVQKSPQKTAPVQNTGQKSTIPAQNYNSSGN